MNIHPHWAVGKRSFSELAVLVGFLVLAFRVDSQTNTVSTFAGLPLSRGTNDGSGTSARFSVPTGVATDSSGNIYVADYLNDTIRKITPTGVVTTLAGSPGSQGTSDGTGGAAQFYLPYGVAVDSSGNVYVTDSGNNTIRKVTPGGVVTTFAGSAGPLGSADGAGNAAQFAVPTGIAVDGIGNVYVADEYNCTVRMITPAGVVTTLAGVAGNYGNTDGTGSEARFAVPTGLAVDSSTNVYVADSGNNTIRKITPAGVVTTLAGLPGSNGSVDGTGNTARFFAPAGIGVDSFGNLYVADTENNTIRKVTPSGTNWVVTTAAGLAGYYNYGTNDGTGSMARFYNPQAVAVDASGNLYVADFKNCTIRRGFPANGAPLIVNASVNSSFMNGQFGFNVAGPAGQPVIVQISTNMKDWACAWTNTIGSGALPFVDQQSSSYPFRFYRTANP
jgi:sugar lactone lactonase YvrE